MEEIWNTFKTAPAEAWVGFVGVIFGSLLTTFGVWLTYWLSKRHLRIQHKHEDEMRRSQQHRERLEELYVLVGRWAKVIFSDTLLLGYALKGDTTYKDYLESIQKMMSQNSAFGGNDAMRLEMIIGIYGHSIQASYEEAMAARDALNVVKREPIATLKAGKPAKQFLKPVLDADRTFERAAVALKNEITKATKQL